MVTPLGVTSFITGEKAFLENALENPAQWGPFPAHRSGHDTRGHPAH